MRRSLLDSHLALVILLLPVLQLPAPLPTRHLLLLGKMADPALTTHRLRHPKRPAERKMTSVNAFQRMIKQWREQQRNAVNQGRQQERKAKRRRAACKTRKATQRRAALKGSLEIQRQYNGVDFTIAEACSAEFTDDEALVDDGQSQARPLRRVVPYWRSLELHEALAVNRQREQNILAQTVQHTELRPRRDAAPVRYPSLDADVEPLPSIIQRWMVSSEFARLFQEAVKHVSLNTILPNQASAMIKDSEQWGQHPPYDVLRSSETYQDHAELDPALFLGNNDSLGDVNEPGGDGLLCSGSGEERLVVPGPNRSLFQRRR